MKLPLCRSCREKWRREFQSAATDALRSERQGDQAATAKAVSEAQAAFEELLVSVGLPIRRRRGEVN